MQGTAVITFVESTAGITPDMLHGFFDGWPNPPSTQKHLEILQGSYAVVIAIDSVDGKVVGFINAVSDGVLAAYIPLLEVLPSYRNRGLGSELVRRMLKSLSDLYMVDLVCDKELQTFYEKLGMVPMLGMAVRNMESQSGR